MSEPGKVTTHTPSIKRYSVVLASVWTLTVGVSLMWGYLQQRDGVRDMARQEALARFEKDVIYRRWNAGHGGVYAPRTESTPSNRYLDDTPERDLVTTSGRALTLVNPAYMTRQVHELGLAAYGARGHITSLKPIRPANTPDPWEDRALEAFERGEREVVSIEMIEGEPHLRFMRPLPTEKGCLKCHAQQGYKLGTIRGGISVSVPTEPYLVIARRQSVGLAVAHVGLWVLGLAGIGFGTKRLLRHERERDHANAEREKMIAELQDALDHIKTLRGIIPICANCKKIRDDDGFWNQVEVYVRDHSEAEFTHGLCPDCVRELYPDFVANEDEPDAGS